MAAGPRQPKHDSQMIDPDTVLAVRRAVQRGTLLVGEGSRVGGRKLADWSVAGARWAGPRVREATIAGAQALGRGCARACRWSWAKRQSLTRVGHRLLWWGALAILVFVGQALLSGRGSAELLETAMFWFGGGLSMSVLVLLGAPETRMRVGAFALASGHGALGLLALLTAA